MSCISTAAGVYWTWRDRLSEASILVHIVIVLFTGVPFLYVLFTSEPFTRTRFRPKPRADVSAPALADVLKTPQRVNNILALKIDIGEREKGFLHQHV